MDLSNMPYKVMASHANGVRAVAFHKKYPLFATASDDATVHVLHGGVSADLNQNALIVPLKILRAHTPRDVEGVIDCVFHPTQPWLFSAGADNTIALFCDDN
jgi:ribosome biogenesis protein ERB1